MTDIIKQILHSDLGTDFNNGALLIFRVSLALELFTVHGMKKFRIEDGKKQQVPNPLHLPEKLNANIATFSDTIVPFFIIVGLAVRLAVLPTITVAAVAYFLVHRKDTPEIRDVPFMYILSLLLILVLGPGKYSFDYYILDLI